jgi:transcription termination factor Rho
MPSHVCGVLKLNKKNGGVLRDPARSFRTSPTDPHVPPQLVRKCALSEGVLVSGSVQKRKHGYVLDNVDSVCGIAPEQFRQRPRFAELVAIDPRERFDLGRTGDVTMRALDLIAPIGKGTRGLIVSPPKAGKTTILEKLARAIREVDPETRVVALLIDERPEEVTAFRRATEAEVLASSNDQSLEDHVELAELTLGHIRSELECGCNVVILVDSLTRMGRAFNLKSPGRGRTMSGGMEAGALEIPRRFFGMARNIENGGSVTVIATCLVDTGSRMDQLIFQEFKGTGNSELVLDRERADERIFPALNVAESGTRKEELLYTEDGIRGLRALRRLLAEHNPREALEFLLHLIDRFPTNDELLASLVQ